MANYKKGQVVFERIRPNQKLIVVEIRGNVYSCVAQENPSWKPLTYFERDLKAADQEDSDKLQAVHSA